MPRTTLPVQPRRGRSFTKIFTCLVLVIPVLALVTLLATGDLGEDRSSVYHRDSLAEQRFEEKRRSFFVPGGAAPPANNAVVPPNNNAASTGGNSAGGLVPAPQLAQGQEPVAVANAAAAAAAAAEAANQAAIAARQAADYAMNKNHVAKAVEEADKAEKLARAAVLAAQSLGANVTALPQRCGFDVPPVFFVDRVYEPQNSPVGEQFMKAAMKRGDRMKSFGWHYTKPRDESALARMRREELNHPGQVRFLVNHIPKDEHFHFKGYMADNLHRYDKLPKTGDQRCFVVDKFALPIYYFSHSDECTAFAQEAPARNVGWVSKPGTTGGHNSNGIRFWNSAQDIINQYRCHSDERARDVVVQSKLTRPLLVHGHFFDIRVYMLVANVKPAVVFFTSGWLRLSSSTLNPGEVLSEKHISTKHEGAAVVGDARRMSFQQLEQVLKEQGKTTPGLADRLQRLMRAMSAHVFRAAEPNLDTSHGPFALYGLDFFVDEDVLPLFNEVSHSPNYKLRDSDIITRVVPQMLYDHIFVVEDVKKQISCNGVYENKWSGVWDLVINDASPTPYFIDQTELCSVHGK